MASKPKAAHPHHRRDAGSACFAYSTTSHIKRTYAKDKWKRKLERLPDPYSLGNWNVADDVLAVRAKTVGIDSNRTYFSGLQHFTMERAKQ